MSNPYPFDASDPNSISFYTSNGIGYLIYFRSSPDFFDDYPEFAEDVMTFGIAVEDNPSGHLPTDSRIGDTVRYVIRSYFDQNPNGVLFFCIDDHDGKQLMRKRLFERWYRQEGATDIEKRNVAIGTATEQTHFSLLFRKGHPHSKLILDRVESFILFIKAKD